MGFIRILIGVLVVLVGVLMLAAILRARRHAVASLVRPLVVEILLRRHQVAALVGSGMVAGVVALSHSLALLVERKRGNEGETNRQRPQWRKTTPCLFHLTIFVDFPTTAVMLIWGGG